MFCTDRQIPSILSYVDGEEYNGQQAKQQLIRNHKNTVAYFRDFVGQEYGLLSVLFKICTNINQLQVHRPHALPWLSTPRVPRRNCRIHNPGQRERPSIHSHCLGDHYQAVQTVSTICVRFPGQEGRLCRPHDSYQLQRGPEGCAGCCCCRSRIGSSSTNPRAHRCSPCIRCPARIQGQRQNRGGGRSGWHTLRRRCHCVARRDVHHSGNCT